jgi:hypothetical protein
VTGYGAILSLVSAIKTGCHEYLGFHIKGEQMLIANPGIQAQQFQDLARDKGLGRDRARVFLENGIKAGTVRADGLGRDSVGTRRSAEQS